MLLESVPAESTAVGVPARVVRVAGRKPVGLDHVHIPDPVAQELCKLQFKIDKLEKRIRELEKDGDAGEQTEKKMAAVFGRITGAAGWNPLERRIPSGRPDFDETF